MKTYILAHYRRTETFTYAGGYKDYFRSLPDDIAVLGREAVRIYRRRVCPEESPVSDRTQMAVRQDNSAGRVKCMERTCLYNVFRQAYLCYR